MSNTDQTAILLNSVLNFLNLALTAWILAQARGTRRTVGRNARVAKRTIAKVEEVQKNTDGKLSDLLQTIETMGQQLAEVKTSAMAANRRRVSRSRPKSREK